MLLWLTMLDRVDCISLFSKSSEVWKSIFFIWFCSSSNWCCTRVPKCTYGVSREWSESRDIQQMAQRCPNASYLGNTMLEDWRLIFKSVATIEKDLGKYVPVGVFQITDACEKAFFEGFEIRSAQHKSAHDFLRLRAASVVLASPEGSSQFHALQVPRSYRFSRGRRALYCGA